MGTYHRFRNIALAVIISAVMQPFTPADASESSYEKFLTRGISAIGREDYTSGITELQSALNEHPEAPEALLYLGIALSRTRNSEAESVLKHALKLDPGNPRIHLELGAYYLSQSSFVESADYLETASHLDPGTELALKAQELLQYITPKMKERRWWVKFLTGMQYDSNVILNAVGAPLPRSFPTSSDWRGIFNGRVNYTFLRTDTLELSAGYSFYQSLHTRLDTYNITQNSVDTEVKWVIRPHLYVKGVMTGDWFLLGGNSYGKSLTVGPSIIYEEGDRLATVMDYRVRLSLLDNSSLFNDNSDRNGANHQISITQTAPLGKKVTMRAGYSHEEETTKNSDWGFSGNKVFVGVASLFPYDVLGDLYGEYQIRSFNGALSGGGSNRSDEAWTGGVTLTRFFTKYLGGTVGCTYTRNYSNKKDFDYERVITSMLLSVRY